MDYIVLLVLAVAAGLCDSGEIRSLAHSSQQGILSLAEELYHRASGRSRHEDLGRVLSVIRAVYYNALAGDQTPCKDFRRYECKTTAERMETLKPPDGGDPIFLNREVVELIEYLRDHSCQLMAISDRPPEAAVVSDEESSIDLMLIPMQQRGVGILRDLRILTST
jgi:hypothetical protein